MPVARKLWQEILVLMPAANARRWAWRGRLLAEGNAHRELAVTPGREEGSGRRGCKSGLGQPFVRRNSRHGENPCRGNILVRFMHSRKG